MTPFAITRTLFLFILALTARASGAQTTTPMLTGEFYLRGVMEVASGFRFNADSTFEFFYIYGALDRFGKGTFEQHGDSVVLHSAPKPERDFIFKASKTTDEPQVTIHIEDPNPMVLPYVLCQLHTPDTLLRGESDQQGNIVFPKVPVVDIALLHQFWPERPSAFRIEHPEHNFFEFTIDPRIAEIDFNGLVLRFTGDALEGRHPLLDPEKTYRFTNGN